MNPEILNCQVLMRPQTEDNDGNYRQILYSKTYNDTAFTFQPTIKGNNGYVTQHLYFVSKRQPIKNAEYCVDKHDRIGQYTWFDKKNHPAGKAGFYFVINNELDSSIKPHDLRKIEATSDKSIETSLIPLEFIKEFVEKNGHIHSVQIKCHNYEAGLGGNLWDPTLLENKTVIIIAKNAKKYETKNQYWAAVVEFLNTRKDVIISGEHRRAIISPELCDELNKRFGEQNYLQEPHEFYIFSQGVKLGTSLGEKASYSHEDLVDHFEKLKI